MASSAFADQTVRINELAYAISSENRPLKSVSEGSQPLVTQIPFDFTLQSIYGSLNSLPTVTAVNVEFLLDNVLQPSADLDFTVGGNPYVEVTGLNLNISKNTELTIRISQSDTGESATGLKVYLSGYRSQLIS